MLEAVSKAFFTSLAGSPPTQSVGFRHDMRHPGRFARLFSSAVREVCREGGKPQGRQAARQHGGLLGIP